MKQILFLNNEYTILDDKNNCFDYDLVSSYFTEYFTEFDYVLGDFSYGKIRMKGFYDDSNKKANNFNKISTLKEYIKNYCAYGCDYFVIKKIKNNN